MVEVFLRMARVILHLSWGFVALGVTVPARFRYKRQMLAHRWCKKALDIIGIELVVEGRIEPGCMQVANHISWLDIIAMMAAGCRGFVSKSEVARWPMVGQLVSGLDTIFIERGAWQTQMASDMMRERLLKGESVLFFPEGTTTDGRRILHFHARLFEAAIVTESSVQPLAIKYEVPGGDYNAVPYVGDISFMQNLAAVMRQPKVVVKLMACEPIPVAGYDRKGLAREARGRIVEMLALNGAIETDSSVAEAA